MTKRICIHKIETKISHDQLANGVRVAHGREREKTSEKSLNFYLKIEIVLMVKEFTLQFIKENISKTEYLFSFFLNDTNN